MESSDPMESMESTNYKVYSGWRRTLAPDWRLIARLARLIISPDWEGLNLSSSGQIEIFARLLPDWAYLQSARLRLSPDWRKPSRLGLVPDCQIGRYARLASCDFGLQIQIGFQIEPSARLATATFQRRHRQFARLARLVVARLARLAIPPDWPDWPRQTETRLV